MHKQVAVHVMLCVDIFRVSNCTSSSRISQSQDADQCLSAE